MRLTRQVRTAGVLAALVAVAVAAGSAGAAALVAGEQRDNAQQQLDRRSSLVAAAVTAEAGRYVDTLRMVAADLSGPDAPTAARFTQAVQPLDDMRLAGAASIGFVVPSAAGDVTATQARWRARGVPQLTLHPAEGNHGHMFSVVSRRFDARPATTGVDFSPAPAPAQALARSRRTGQVSVSDAYQLLADRQLPAAQRQLSFALTAPVYGPATEAGPREFRGWVVMAMRGQDFMGATLTRLSQNLIDVTLHAPGTDGTRPAVAALIANTPEHRDLRRTADVAVADRNWSLTVNSVAKLLPGGSTRLPLLVAVVGTLIGLLSAGLVWVLATGRARAEARVRTAVARLSAARDGLAQQRTYLTQVLDNLDTAVITCDTTGAIVHANQTIVDWSRAHGATGTGAAPDDLDRALARALFGHSIMGEEMTIEPPGRPRRNLLVDARPLRDYTGRIIGAVCSASDITVLREREADLQAFAGVVAHDLKGPLGAVAGFAEILDDHLDAGTTEPTQLRPALNRIRSGMDRMRRLIDDLLAYATARDAQLHREPVDLQALVAEVVTERTAPLRAGRVPQAQLPTIETGPLPVVNADPAMIRQLLDNLIGNALKYTRPGQPAHIAISSRPAGGGTAGIEIADRGIGIPAADQPHVFTSFHRSASHRGYAGTGLGLSICQRIIDRHEGTITVSDNPGGGTRMRFTLPTVTGAGLPNSSHPAYAALPQGRVRTPAVAGR
ncbi:ATP-binding protein [Krasilnikovia sp. MM14-A1259]|uniref:ATP-binding protein n=1 Tax=Krasilnikovia sp. MM14-A1259 TaxID=3373539 RepID=UPI00399C5BB1